MTSKALNGRLQEIDVRISALTIDKFKKVLPPDALEFVRTILAIAVGES